MDYVEIDTLTGDKVARRCHAQTIGRFETTPYKELDKLHPSDAEWLAPSPRMNDVDLVIAQSFSVLGAELSRETMHETTYVFWSHPSQSSDDLFDGIAKVWAKLQHHLETANFTVRHADHICAVSEASREYIASKTGRNAIYVPNSVPSHGSPRSRPEKKSRNGTTSIR